MDHHTRRAKGRPPVVGVATEARRCVLRFPKEPLRRPSILRSGRVHCPSDRRAGHSVAELYRVYAKVLDGRRDQANALIERAMRAAEQESEEA
ncbi:hypothetical protein [Streptomyces sp. NPDC058989]|uniref:hypothetical protein n=1 Tax=Streptomyces sp. NPDC058989 TaxID=3346686 RepID=UPI00369800B5